MNNLPYYVVVSAEERKPEGPLMVFFTLGTAREVAKRLAEQHNEPFYVAKIVPMELYIKG